MYAFIQRIAVYTMDNQIYGVQNAHILFSVLLSEMDNQVYRIYNMHTFIQRTDVCIRQENVQSTKCTYLLSMFLSAMVKRMHRIQNARIFSVYCCLQWTVDCIKN